ncbi:hypothetical protein FKP32DRAFT_489450 [Trametes sanguinea]|nr:hypothetical protein FKP32DRAFT_489450 [Trametes sanguinea]
MTHILQIMMLLVARSGLKMIAARPRAIAFESQSLPHGIFDECCAYRDSPPERIANGYRWPARDRNVPRIGFNLSRSETRTCRARRRFLVAHTDRMVDLPFADVFRGKMALLYQRHAIAVV